MGQSDILQVLKQQPNKWFTTIEISEICKVNNSTIIARMKTLREINFVDYKLVKTDVRIKKRHYYKHKK